MGGRANFAAEVLGEKQRVFQWIRRWMRENEAEEKNVSYFVFFGRKLVFPRFIHHGKI